MRAKAIGSRLLCAMAWLPLVAAAPAAAPVPAGIGTLTLAGETATTLYVPASLDRTRPAPMVLLLHGSTSSGRETLAHSGLMRTADLHGFVIAAPDGAVRVGRGFAWNIPGVPAVNGRLPAKGDRDDVRHLLAIIDGLAARGLVDPARVYATGISGGGRMASWLACVAPARIAAIAPVVGLRAGAPSSTTPDRPDPASCHPSMPVPVLAFAGDADTVNPIAGGGARYWQYGLHAAEQRWAAINGCTQTLPTRWVAPKVYEESFGGCRDGATVAARVTVGGGHTWVADNEAMWGFFAPHRREVRGSRRR